MVPQHKHESIRKNDGTSGVPERVDHFLDFIRFFRSHLLSGSEGGNEGGQRALVRIVHDPLALRRVILFFRDPGSDERLLVLQEAFLAEHAEHGVGRGLVPV